jgi:hypothetical protein
MMSALSLVYLGCAATSFLCLIFLFRGYRRTGVRFLFWMSLCFLGLALNNLFLVLDIIVYPDTDLMPLRQMATTFAVVTLLYGLIWDGNIWS